MLPRPALLLSALAAGLLPHVATGQDSSAAVQEPAPSPRERVEEAVEALMTRHSIPGVGLAVFREGKIEWAAGFGVKERGTDRKVTVSTRFQAASISKPVAALGALRMVERGELELDADVNDFLLDWQLPEHDFDVSVTLRRIVSHNAGLTVHGFPGYDSRTTAAHLVDVLDGEPPANTPAILCDTEPGSITRYSGGGYCVMQQMMIDMSDEEFPDLLQELVLAPLGMEHSTYAQPLPEDWQAEAAHGHRGRGLPVPGRWHVYPEMAAAGLWTTPSDLARFAIALARAAGDEEDGILSREMAREMLSRQGSPSNGLGVFLRAGGVTFEHGGSNDGFKCQLFCQRDTISGAAIMTNADSGSRLAQALIPTLIEVYGWPEGLMR